MVQPYEGIMIDANRLVAERKNEAALAEYGKAIRLDPGRERGYCGAALASAQMERRSDAIARMEDLIRVRPNAAYAHAFIGYMMEIDGEYDGALAAYDKALEMDPGNVAVLVQKHYVLNLAGRPEEGSWCIDRALALAPAVEVAAHVQVARSEAKSDVPGDYSCLQPGFRQVCEIVFWGCVRDLPPDTDRLGREYRTPEELFDMANSLADQGRHADALETVEMVIAADPNFADAHDARGTFLARLGRYEEAIASVDEVLRIRPDNAGYIGAKGMLFERLGLHDRAAACYDRMVRLDPGDMTARHLKCSLLAAAGDAKGLVECYREALACKPSSKRSAGAQKAMRREYRELMRRSASGSLASGFAKFVKGNGVSIEPRWGRKT